MRKISSVPAVIFGSFIFLAGSGGLAQDAAPDRPDTLTAAPASRPADTQPAALNALIDQLGDEAFTIREEATRQLIVLGPTMAELLQARLERETDPEIRYRLWYVLEHIVPPDRAVLVVRGDPAIGLRCGDLITHVNSRRVRETRELQYLMGDSSPPLVLRVLGTDGPREIGPVSLGQTQTFGDYRVPEGETIVRLLRLYNDGYAEQAYEIAKELGSVPETELSALLRARIAYTAGDGATAQRLLKDRADTVQTSDWISPSLFDLAGPGKAPFHLEWRLWGDVETVGNSRERDPDMRVQRVLIPARRYRDALQTAAELWWTRYRASLNRREADNRIAGNMLAVTSWMLSEMGLLSECLKLIQPRSDVLGQKWIRVRTDAWLPFLQGKAKEALDSLYDDARDVLTQAQAVNPSGSQVFTRVPNVAATVAFFLYQQPADPRVEDMLNVVNRPGYPVLAAYAQWMLFSLNEENAGLLRKHLPQILLNLSDAEALPYARAAALLEYVQNVPDDDVMVAARQRLALTPDTPERALWLALIDALRHLAAGHLETARAALQPVAEQREAAALRATLEFLTNPPPGAAEQTALQAPLLAVPLGKAGGTWLVLTRDKRLVRFDATRNQVVPLEKPSPTWFPNPLAWPWIGREEASGRVWTYDRRRVVELGREDGPPVRLNIRTRDIPEFDRIAGLAFSTIGIAASATGSPMDENGEFLREDVRANGEYVSDPNLPEIGQVRTLPNAPRFAQIALRGGENFLIDTITGRVWSSAWFNAKAGNSGPACKTFIAQAIPAATPDGSPTIFLIGDGGLLRFEPEGETLTRIALPGPEPHPALIPESTPYVRRDFRWVYCARPPEAGGQVFRVRVADNQVESMDMVNEGLPEDYYDLQSRAVLRAELSQRLQAAQMPPLREFVQDAVQAVGKWKKDQQR